MLTLTADGCQEVATLPDTGCCPPPLCGNELCCTFVAFFQILPSGPLWDYWKAAAISYFQYNSDPKDCPLIADPDCPSMVLHAIYAVLKLKKMVNDALWPALRESDPFTAVSTLDAWLKRLQWEDCYNQHCRSVILGEITPYEILTECGPVFCDPEFSPELAAAVKHNILRALTRAQMGVIKNLCGLNWVIEPLGAELTARQPQAPNPTPVAPCDDGCPPNIGFVISPNSDWLEGAGSGELCEAGIRPKVPAVWDRACNKPAGLPDQIWPGVLAAECIVRSMLPSMCPGDIVRVC